MPDSGKTRNELLSEVKALRQRLAHFEASQKDKRGKAPPVWINELLQALGNGIEEYAVFMLDSEGHVTAWNAGAERLWGYREEEILGQHATCFYTSEDIAREKPTEDLRRASVDGKCNDEGWRVRKDGSRFLANLVMTALYDETHRSYRIACIACDITEHKKAGVALRESERRFQAFMENTLAVNFIKDEEGYYIYANRTFEERLHLTETDWKGATDFELWPTEIAHSLRANDQTILDDNQPCELIEFVPTLEGEAIWLVCKFPFTLGEGKRFIGGTAFDITEQERAKQEIERLNEELEYRVLQRTSELTAANKELTAFSYSVSHDLRTPLRAIDGFSQALIEDYGHTLDTMGLDYLKRVRAEAQRMGELIDALLNLSRVARAELHRDTVDLSEMTLQIAEGLKHRDPHRQVEFVIAEGQIAQGDERLLRIVLENLLENAWKFTSSRPQAQIEFGVVQHTEDSTAWYVRDNGVGFDMTYVTHLFGAFHRLHGETEFPGTGIGLATVQRIIHRHGGHIWTDAMVNQGATFFFTL